MKVLGMDKGSLCISLPLLSCIIKDSAYSIRNNFLSLKIEHYLQTIKKYFNILFLTKNKYKY